MKIILNGYYIVLFRRKCQFVYLDVSNRLHAWKAVSKHKPHPPLLPSLPAVSPALSLSLPPSQPLVGYTSVYAQPVSQSVSQSAIYLGSLHASLRCCAGQQHVC